MAMESIEKPIQTMDVYDTEIPTVVKDLNF